MADKTILVMPGKKLQVPRLLKRALLVAGSVALTAALVLAIVMGNGFHTARGRFLQGWDAWLGFINRPDILATMILTSIVTVLFVYWHRDQERK